MLEIIIIYQIKKYVGRVAEQKGLKKLGYQIMAALLWLSGELTAGFLSASFFDDKGIFSVYILGLVGALIGLGITLLIENIGRSRAESGTGWTFWYSNGSGNRERDINSFRVLFRGCKCITALVVEYWEDTDMIMWAGPILCNYR